MTPTEPAPARGHTHYHRGFGASSNVGTFTPLCGARVGASTSNAALVTCQDCIRALADGASRLSAVRGRP